MGASLSMPGCHRRGAPLPRQRARACVWRCCRHDGGAVSGERTLHCIKPQCALTWIGHATVLIDTGGTRLLTDPALGGRSGPLRRYAVRVGPNATEGVDAVLLSHLHLDHADLRSLRALGRDVPVVAPPGAARWLTRRRFRRVQALAEGASTRIGETRISATSAIHDGRRWKYVGCADAVGFVVEGRTSVYFAGDTDVFPAMADLRGRVDVALLPVAGWGPTLPPGHMDPERAAEAVALIRPQLAIPIHWGTFGLPWRRPRADELAAPARAFAAAAATVAPEVEVRVLQPGESTTLARETA
jgi:L-ascorbate metabolism protein UlaG (beta-lactamase superfamily)